MHYLKPPLSFSQQAQRLNDHGLIINDINLVIERLSTVSYYRLSAYWHPFKGADDRFVAGTTFDQIWRRYTFDRHLRLLVMDAIERVEVAVLRTLMVEQFTLMYGPFGYRSITNYWPGCNQDEHNRLLSEIDAAFARSKETFVQHFRTKYTSEPHPPLWMIVEVMTYGQLFTMFRQLRRQEQKNIAVKMGIHQPVLDSWLHTLNYVRNVVAHHARLWNREMPIRPKMPEQRHRPEFHTPASTNGERMFGVLSLLRYLISRVAPQSEWPQRVVHLLDEYREIPLTSMGFPTNWRDYPLWKS